MLQSIYTHAGCDYGCLYTYSPRHCFNPHTHAGCDIVRSANPNISDCFNPHTHAGCDSLIALEVYLHYGFQSTHPRRVWLLSINRKMSILMFQSTHPRRVWLFIIKTGIEYEKFQSTHPRRVWLILIDLPLTWVRFNPHTHAGCDTVKRHCALNLLVSIHTPTQGVTWLPVALGLISPCFNPHTHAGCDIWWPFFC